MINAEYVKSLGLEFKDLTAKIEDYSEADKLYTWGILNKKTNKQIGSYHSLDKKDFPVVPVIIGEWLLQEDAHEKDHFNINSKALLRYKLNKIVREFVNDTSISDQCLYKNRLVYFANRQSYADRVNKLLGKDLCDTFHNAFPNGERKEIYIMYDSKRYILGSACGEAREVCYDKIYEFVDKYMDSICNKDQKESLGDDLYKIAMEFLNDVMNDDMQDRQSYIDRVNKLVGRDICVIRYITYSDWEETKFYVEWLGDTYLLGSVLVFRNTNSKKVTVHCNRIKAFVEKYPHPANNYSMANQLLYSLLETSCGRFHENFNFRNYKNSIYVLQDMARDVSEIIEPAECKFVLEYGYYDLNVYYKDKKYVLAYCNEDKTNFHKVESNIEEFVYDFLEDTINEQ